MPETIYLDNNASTLLAPEVIDEMIRCYRSSLYNPASPHLSGQHARRWLDRAKSQILSLLGGSQMAPYTDQLIITSGGTEANNLAIRGLPHGPGHILVTSIEHPSVLGAAESLRGSGFDVEYVDPQPTGQINPTDFLERLRSDTRLVCVMLGNHEVGTLQPIEKLVHACHERGIPIHGDAVQWIGKLPFSFASSGLTSISVTAHKFHGPTGVGALLVRHGVPIRPILFGGTQQLGLRPGTEPVAPVVGMAVALSLALAELTARPNYLRDLRDQLQHGLTSQLPKIVVNGSTADRLPQTLNVSFLGLDRQALVMALDLAGIACSTGSACTSGSSEPSHVLRAMGLGPEVTESAVRFGVSRFTTAAEITAATDRIVRVVQTLRRRDSTSP